MKPLFLILWDLEMMNNQEKPYSLAEEAES